MAIKKLSDTELQQQLAALPDWTLRDGKLYRAIRFVNFSATFSFMTQVALMAEKADHHPEWFNVYNRLEIWLTTHDADGISQRDIDLATAIDALLA
ncbi:MAG TPA: 4a-hydroxytetrahydrobiopterin dehydratase [Spongiibacteraceae bacterium]|nr:4a-hydroxytetrahydrobiopterin dehydratase [Spongiibacteraceae bacterium]